MQPHFHIHQAILNFEVNGHFGLKIGSKDDRHGIGAGGAKFHGSVRDSEVNFLESREGEAGA
jgi:hypothetical protein